MKICELKDEYYHFIFENSLDAVLLTTPDGRVHRANSAACQMFQMTEEEICQKGRAGLIDPEDTRLQTALTTRAKNGKVKAELNLVRSDGIAFPTECTSALFVDNEGKEWTVTIVRDISAYKNAETVLRKAQEDSNWYAATDFLTGILNRRVLMERLEVEMIRAKREDGTLSLLMLDIDSFKDINDTLGHGAGDYILQHIADLLFKKLRPYDFVGRYGGDEFLVCLPNTDNAVSISIAERLRSHIECQKWFYADRAIPITTSIGVCTFYGCNPKTVDEIISVVDKNMYIAKQKKNCVYGVDDFKE